MLIVPLGINIIYGVKNDEENDDDIQNKISVYMHTQDRIQTMDREEYILGVLMAEMPAEFELEALKAQAVAARTYMAEKSNNEADIPEHNGADVCTDFAHCQAYISTKDAKKKWGKNASLYFEKCKNAVESTRDIIAVYDGEPIKAVFHAFASGKTENASDVWGSDVIYLKSVESPGDMTAPGFESSVEIPLDKFREVLSTEFGNYPQDITISNIIRNESGYVSTVQIGDRIISGKKLRALFELRSACFDIIPTEKSIVFNVRGYGHGVGMSQYGANYFAKKGMTYDEILTTYYSNIQFDYLE